MYFKIDLLLLNMGSYQYVILVKSEMYCDFNVMSEL